MAFRTSQIYIQASTRARLRLVCELYPFASKDSATASNVATIDEVGDLLLQEVIKNQFPAVLEVERELDAVKKKYRKEANEKKNE